MNVNNCRGVCLQTMSSMVLARVIAKRVARRAEHLELLNENKAWFMKARSTADIMQMMVRMEENVMEEQIERTNSVKFDWILVFPLPMIIKCDKLVW